ncbi:transcriptional regulator, partial [Yersinia pestis subsp. pestis]
MEEKLTGNELEMLYAAADYRRAEIVMNQYFV